MTRKLDTYKCDELPAFHALTGRVRHERQVLQEEEDERIAWSVWRKFEDGTPALRTLSQTPAGAKHT